MNVVELRDLDAAREYVVQGLWLQRVLRPTAATVKPALSYALEIASEGHPLPPIGFVADLAAVALGTDSGKWSKGHEEIPGWPHTLTRSYEDHLLGKLYADWTFERASDALRRYQERDRVKGLAYIVKQFRSRGRLGGVEMSPAVFRSLLSLNPEELLAQGYESLSRNGPLPLLHDQYEELVKAARRMAEVLDPEDVIALEQRTALADMGEYVAHRHILQATARFESRLPTRPVRPLVGRREVPTRVFDEDQYPVGGYTSISNRGSIESLLHSQLAYMEENERPDLFDTKFVRDELFYYSRDENQFLRRRRVFLFVFDPSLVHTRVKDAALPFQRVVLTAAVVLAVVRRLSDWLSTDALRFELLFPIAEGKSPLDPEAKLFEILLSEMRANGTAAVARHGGKDGKNPTTNTDQFAGVLTSPDGWHAYAEKLSHTSQVQVLTLGRNPEWAELEGAVTYGLAVNAATPVLTDGHGEPTELAGDGPMEVWTDAVLRVLQLWV
jgi:vWA domain found in the FtsH ternary systems/N-terminal helical region fused to the FtsH ternary system vWA domain